MTYERQESAIDFTGNREAEAETADYVALHGEEIIETHLAESMADLAKLDAIVYEGRLAAERESIGTVTKKICIDYRWMEAERHITDDVFEPRYRMPRICGLDVEHAAADAFKNFYVHQPRYDGTINEGFPRTQRINIREIRLSKATEWDREAHAEYYAWEEAK